MNDCNTSDDAAWVKAALDGQQAAYARLYDRYGPLVRALCHDATRDLNQAQDLAQETFLRAFVKLPELRDSARFAPWLLAITKLICREWRRKRFRDRHEFVGDLADQERASADDSIESIDGHLQLRQVHDALATLPEVERTALHLFYLQEQPAEQARTILKLSRSGFYRVLERACGRLRKRMRQEV